MGCVSSKYARDDTGATLTAAKTAPARAQATTAYMPGTTPVSSSSQPPPPPAQAGSATPTTSAPQTARKTKPVTAVTPTVAADGASTDNGKVETAMQGAATAADTVDDVNEYLKDVFKSDDLVISDGRAGYATEGDSIKFFENPTGSGVIEDAMQGLQAIADTILIVRPVVLLVRGIYRLAKAFGEADEVRDEFAKRLHDMTYYLFTTKCRDKHAWDRFHTALNECKTELNNQWQRNRQRGKVARFLFASSELRRIQETLSNKVKEARDDFAFVVTADTNAAAHRVDGKLDDLKDIVVQGLGAVKDQQAQVMAQVTVLTAEVNTYRLHRAEMPALPATIEALQHFTFHKDIEDKSKEFMTGTRVEVVTKFEAFLKGGGGGGDDAAAAATTTTTNMFLLLGEAGIGKSTISAMLCNRFAANVVAVHFCQHTSDRLRNVRFVITSLVYQLAQAVPAYRKAVEAVLNTADNASKVMSWQVAELVRELLQEPLKTVTDPFAGMSAEDRAKYVGQRLVVLIDALDESEHNGVNDLLDFLSKQGLPLPAWLGMVVTSRPEEAIVAKLKKRYPNPVKLICSSGDNQRDIRLFLEHRLPPLMATSVSAADKRKAVDVLVDKSEGLFTYASKVLEGRSGLTLADVEALPDGMRDFVLESLERVRLEVDKLKKIDWADAIKCLQVIVVAREALTVEAVARFAGCPLKVAQAFFGNLLKSFFPQRSADDKDSACHCAVITFYHKSIRDIVTDEALDDLVADEYAALFVDPNEGQRCMAEACYELLVDSSSASKSVTGASCLVLRFDEAMKAKEETHAAVRYAVRHAAEHLCETGRVEDAVGLLCNLQMPELRLVLEGGIKGGRGAGQALVAELLELAGRLASALGGPGDKAKRAAAERRVADYTRFLRSHVVHWADKGPRLVGSYAWNYPDKTVVFEDAQAMKAWWQARGDWLEWVKPNKVQALSAEVMRLTHDDELRSVAYSHDGRLIASACDDKVVRLLDAATGAFVATLEGHTDIVRSVAFSPDGKLVVSGSDDKTVRLWDVASGEEVKCYEGDEARTHWSEASARLTRVLDRMVWKDDKVVFIATGLPVPSLDAASSSVDKAKEEGEEVTAAMKSRVKTVLALYVSERFAMASGGCLRFHCHLL